MVLRGRPSSAQVAGQGWHGTLNLAPASTRAAMLGSPSGPALCVLGKSGLLRSLQVVVESLRVLGANWVNLTPSRITKGNVPVKLLRNEDTVGDANDGAAPEACRSQEPDQHGRGQGCPRLSRRDPRRQETWPTQPVRASWQQQTERAGVACVELPWVRNQTKAEVEAILNTTTDKREA